MAVHRIVVVVHEVTPRPDAIPELLMSLVDAGVDDIDVDTSAGRNESSYSPSRPRR